MEKIAKNKKESKDEKLKAQKIEEQVIKTLEEAATPEEKFQLLLSKHVESQKASKKLNQNIKGQEKQLEVVLREKEALQREYNKSVLMRDKLEQVCREQQKLIKSVKNESMQKIREEEERRKESQSKFQASLNDITQSLCKNNEENLKLRDLNIEMTKKLKFLAEQYETRELQLKKLNEQVQLESQLHLAKMNKMQVEAAMEKEILIKEKQIAMEKLLQSQKMLKELSEREIALKEQLNLYTAKYDDFQSSLQKSNDIFATYKVEMEKMSKNTKKLEKESLEWKRKWEKSNATLIELATEKQERDEHAARCNKQVDQLQKLLRALQHERTHLYKVLRENNIEIPAMPPLPPEPEHIKPVPIQSTVDKDKMELMSKNCAELKETLANLQSQMKFLNMKSAANAELDSLSKPAPPQEDSNKKRKNKKPKGKNNNKSLNTVSAENNDGELNLAKAQTENEMNAVVSTETISPALVAEATQISSALSEETQQTLPDILEKTTDAVEVTADNAKPVDDTSASVECSEPLLEGAAEPTDHISVDIPAETEENKACSLENIDETEGNPAEIAENCDKMVKEVAENVSLPN